MAFVKIHGVEIPPLPISIHYVATGTPASSNVQISPTHSRANTPEKAEKSLTQQGTHSSESSSLSKGMQTHLLVCANSFSQKMRLLFDSKAHTIL